MGIGFAEALSAIQVVAAVATAFALWRRPCFPDSRTAAVWFGVLWVVLATAEFWALGPWSFLDMADSVGVVIPTQQWLAGLPAGTQFGHAAAGGNDVDGLLAFTGQKVSLERLLLIWLPLWPAEAVHKLLVAGIAFFGAYRMARAVGAARRIATGLAAVHVFGHETYIISSWSHGLGHTIIPLAILLIVLRAGRRLYWPGVVLVSALYAASSLPTHSGPALLCALLAATALCGRAHLGRIAAALLLLSLVVLANWHDSLLAKALIAPFTDRGTTFNWAFGNWRGLLGQLAYGGSSVVVWPLAALAAGAAVLRGGGFMLRGLAVLALAKAAGPLLGEVPWKAIPGLGLLAALNLHSMATALIATALLVTAAALAGPAAARRGSRLMPVALFALAVSAFAHFKAYDLAALLAEGNLAHLHSVDEIDVSALATGTPTRGVTIPYRLTGNMLWQRGIETFDGEYNLLLSSTVAYWDKGLLPPGKHDLASGLLALGSPSIDLKCCETYNLADFADLDLLRVANVGLVFSRLPLDGLTQIGGPTGRAPTRRSQPLPERLAGYLREVFHPAGIRVYRLDGALPRVFAATGVEVAPDGTDPVPLVRIHGLARRAVVNAAHAGAKAPAAAVTAIRLVPNGVEAELAAPDGGLILVNVPYTPFWSAKADGVPVELFPANLIHMAAPVPAGTRQLTLSYRRPTLADRLAPGRPGG